MQSKFRIQALRNQNKESEYARQNSRVRRILPLYGGFDEELDIKFL